MGTETKVGLLVGLAFIICFAVILANRGQSGAEGPPQPILTDGVQTRVSSTDRSLSPTSARDDQGEAGSRTSASGSDSGRIAGGPKRVDGQSRVPSAPVPAEGREPGALSSGASSPVGETALSAVTQPAGNPSLYQAPASLQEQQQILREMLQRSSTRPTEAAVVEGAARPPATPVSVTSPTSTGPPESAGRAPVTGVPAASYVVRPGDTLSRIAASHYGSRSSRFIRAIVDANRSLLRDPDVVAVGMTLRLPVMDDSPRPGNSAAKEVLERTAAADPRETTGASAQTTRWYQIRKNDRYATIARDQLGDENRWRELFELNKDKFPDPDAIREGVRIKLPAVSVVEGRQARP